MKLYWWIALAVVVFCGVCAGVFSVIYRSPVIATVSFETYRKKLDEKQNALFVGRFSPMLLLNKLYGNGDKYVFRPPRVVPTFNRSGAVQGYIVYGMVNSWNPESHVVHVSSYLGRPISVRFDPDVDGSMAVMPRLDSYGVAQSITERDFVSSTRDARYDELFCVGDVVSIETPHARQFSYFSRGTPVIPRVIQLSFRLCEK